jgi:hypothetical protein
MLDRPFVRTAGNLPDAALGAGFAGRRDSVKVPTAGHVTSLKRKHPATGKIP